MFRLLILFASLISATSFAGIEYVATKDMFKWSCQNPPFTDSESCEKTASLNYFKAGCRNLDFTCGLNKTKSSWDCLLKGDTPVSSECLPCQNSEKLGQNECKCPSTHTKSTNGNLQVCLSKESRPPAKTLIWGCNLDYKESCETSATRNYQLAGCTGLKFYCENDSTAWNCLSESNNCIKAKCSKKSECTCPNGYTISTNTNAELDSGTLKVCKQNKESSSEKATDKKNSDHK